MSSSVSMRLKRFAYLRSAAGLAVSTMMLGVLSVACAPGKLPCGEERWRAVCEGDGGSGQGGSGGGGGGQGGSGGSSGINAETAVASCAMYPTLGEMDKFFAARCGLDGKCHTSPGAVVWKDLKLPNIWDRMRTIKASASCTGDAPMINTADWSKSVLWQITRSPKGTCPDTGMIARAMPPQDETGNITPPQPLLSDAENTCLENYLKAIADGTP